MKRTTNCLQAVSKWPEPTRTALKSESGGTASKQQPPTFDTFHLCFFL